MTEPPTIHVGQTVADTPFATTPLPILRTMGGYFRPTARRRLLSQARNTLVDRRELRVVIAPPHARAVELGAKR
jgi:hypothetical protein